jgi:aminoglycoside 3-N-acetyltransferase
MTVDITKERLIADLEEMGLNQGDRISIASALSKVGQVEGGPQAFIDAVREVIGPQGTIMVNTYTSGFYIYQIEAANKSRPFDFRTTPSVSGIISETVRISPQARRSCHPMSSVAAIGPKAGFLTDGHGPKAPARLPYSRLAEIGGKSLFVGLGNNLVALRHEAQYRSGLMDAVHVEACINYVDEEGKTRLFRGTDVTACTSALPRLVPSMRQQGILREGTIGDARAILVSSKEAIDFMTNLLQKDPTLNLCDNIACLWCRELERKMSLYKKIKNPRPFQKNIFWIELLALINRHRLKGSPRAIRSISLVGAAYKRMHKNPKAK